MLCMPDPNPDVRELLTQARQRAARLIADLAARRDELESPGCVADALPLDHGKQLLGEAVQSAQRVLHTIDRVLDVTSEAGN